MYTHTIITKKDIAQMNKFFETKSLTLQYHVM